MNEAEALQALVQELQFEFQDDDIVCLYEFGWFLNQYRDSLDDEQINRLCHQAYDEITRGLPLKLVWVDWPTVDPAKARDAAPDTPLDFQVSAAGVVTSPLQALVRLD